MKKYSQYVEQVWKATEKYRNQCIRRVQDNGCGSCKQKHNCKGQEKPILKQPQLRIK